MNSRKKYHIKLQGRTVNMRNYRVLKAETAGAVFSGRNFGLNFGLKVGVGGGIRIQWGEHFLVGADFAYSPVDGGLGVEVERADQHRPPVAERCDLLVQRVFARGRPGPIPSTP